MDLYTYWRTCCEPYLRARFGRDERGASLVEYALLVALIAVVCIVALRFLGGSTNEKINDISRTIKQTTTTLTQAPA